MSFKIARRRPTLRALSLRSAINSVQYVNVMSSSRIASKFAAALAGCSTVRSLWMPRIASSIPSKIVIKPKPPASTTPAFSSTGF